MRVASLHIYPVKGAHRVDQLAAVVQPWGLAGDRRWMPVDEQGVVVSQREEPRLTQVRPSIVDGGLILRSPDMPDLKVLSQPRDPVEVDVWGSLLAATPSGAEADAWLSAVLRRPIRLVWMNDPTLRPVTPDYSRDEDRVSFADAFPILLANSASLDELNGWIAESGSLEGPLPMTRFRPNIVLSGAPPWAEDSWLGGRVRIGATIFRAPKLSDRCVMTTQDQETGAKGKEPLRTLARYRKIDRLLMFGMNLIPDDGVGSIAVGDEVSQLH
jgi:uncharacterized protein